MNAAIQLLMENAKQLRITESQFRRLGNTEAADACDKQAREMEAQAVKVLLKIRQDTQSMTYWRR